MAGTEQISIVELDAADAQAALALSAEANWNQNEADWRFFLSKGIVFGVRDGSRLIATAALLPYSAGNAWISMVLVSANWRRRGIANALVDACLNAARKLELTASLDATPDGAAVYGPRGFMPTLQLRRLRLQNAGTAEAPPSLSSLSLDELSACDRRAMGFERGLLLKEFAGRPGSRMLSADHAMAVVRDGRTARHIGPLFADDPAGALALVHAIVQSETGPWIIDVVASQVELLEALTDAGWNIERPFQRMRFGHAATPGEAPPFAVAGPEFG